MTQDSGLAGPESRVLGPQFLSRPYARGYSRMQHFPPQSGSSWELPAKLPFGSAKWVE